MYIFFLRPDAGGEHVVMWITGCAFLLFGFATIAEGIVIGNLNRQALKPKATVNPVEKEIPETTTKNASLPENGTPTQDSRN